MDDRTKLLQSLKIKNLDDLTNDQLDVLIKNKKVIKVKPKPKVKVIDKTTDKYKIALKLVNKILENLDKDPIDSLTDFKNIDRLDMIKEINNVSFDAISKELFEYFDKTKCGYYRKKDNRVFNCIRGMCKELELNFLSKKKTIQKDTINKTHYFYSIK